MGASCIVQCHNPISENDVITKVEYRINHGEVHGTVRVYYKSHLYNDDREYDCCRSYIWGSKAEDYVKFVVPIINTAPIEGSRYHALWIVKKSTKSDKKSVIAEKIPAETHSEMQLSFF